MLRVCPGIKIILDRTCKSHHCISLPVRHGRGRYRHWPSSRPPSRTRPRRRRALAGPGVRLSFVTVEALRQLCEEFEEPVSCFVNRDGFVEPLVAAWPRGRWEVQRECGCE